MKRFQKTKNNLIYFSVRGLLLVAGAVPSILLEWALGAAGVAGFYLSAKERKVALGNLKTAFGDELSPQQQWQLGRRCFRNLGINGAAFLRSYVRDNPAEIASMVEIRGLENLESARQQGRGVMIISAHLGAFDFIPQALSRAGIPISAVGAKLYDERLDRYIVDARTRHGNDYIPRDDPPRKILRALRENRGVGILIDQDTRVARCFVPFFGKACATPIGAAKIAKASGAPVVFAYTYRDETGKHIVSVSPIIEWLEHPDKEAELIANTAHWTALIEDAVRKHPEQWVWMHKRWKRRPEQEATVES